MPPAVQAAKEWVATNVAAHGQRRDCHVCRFSTTACLHCSTCDHAFCRPCLGVRDGELWSLGFQCPACIIHDVSLDPSLPVDPALEGLAKSMLATAAAALKPGTWALYQRCIADMLAFARQHRIKMFPVDCRAAANGVAIFMEHLRTLGFSWARISHYSAALRSLCAAADLADPFTEYPSLRSLCEGLKKRITLRPRRKEGATLKMVTKLLEFWRRSERAYRAAGKIRLADLALRNQVAVILGFFAMRRKSEAFTNKECTMGLQRHHVSVVKGSHVTLFIQAMKNDPYGFGNEVVMVWVTESGVRIGETVLQYMHRLHECALPADTPFLQPTRDHGFVLPKPCRGFSDNDCFKKGLQQCFQEFDTKELRDRFSWHSLRRGGASHAFRQHTDLRLVMGHGLWKSEAGVRPYMTADLRGKLTVTRAM